VEVRGVEERVEGRAAGVIWTSKSVVWPVVGYETAGEGTNGLTPTGYPALCRDMTRGGR
jgi:hypothetical protein